jgi:hypothetical protein
MKQCNLIIILFYSTFINSQIYDKDCVCEIDTNQSFYAIMKTGKIDTIEGF